MYSQPGRPGPGRGGKGRYMKGRLPQGVDFAAYPGRSSTPLPTAESKSAERINQLKIWNEAATNDDKRRLHTAKSKQALTNAGSANRRTDSFKDARERHSASFQSDSTKEKESPPTEERDIFADRSDSESDEAVEGEVPIPTSKVSEATADEDVIEANPDKIAPMIPARVAPPPPPPPAPAPVPAANLHPVQHAPPPPKRNDPPARPYAAPVAPAPVHSAPPPAAHAAPAPVVAQKPKPDTGHGERSPRQQPPKESKGCCTIQ